MRAWMLTLLLTATAVAAEPSPRPNYPDLPEPVSSLGAAVLDGHVYVYGGHSGKTHTYSTETVSSKFRRFDLANPNKGWEELPGGPPCQGLALVAHAGKIYRIGGMQPRNAPGEPTDNHSLTSCAVYDPKARKWDALPDLPRGRSSHDAVVVGDQLYVAGGWCINGKDKASDWHETMLVLDLAQKDAKWESIAQPFQRRALNLAAFEGKVYVVGGMGASGALDRGLDIYDPAGKKWSRGPELPGSTRNGFTPAACVCANRLLVGPPDGKVYRLNEKRDGWEEITLLEKQRMVHRFVPVQDRWVLAIGGGSRTGNVARVESFDPTAPALPAESPK